MVKKRYRVAAAKLLVVLIFICLFIMASMPFPNRKVTLVFRYDDYSNQSPSQIEIRLIQALKERNMSATFGVIPYSGTATSLQRGAVALEPAKAQILKEAIAQGTIEVALHGHSHAANSYAVLPNGGGSNSEFWGLTYESQKTLISEGKKLLEGLLNVSIDTFIPPWNTYDLTTLRTLEDLGFQTISAGTVGMVSDVSPLTFLPVTCDLANLKSAIESARLSNSPDDSPIVIVLFHPYDFLEHNKWRGTLTFEEFEALLDWVAAQKDVQVRTIRRVAEEVDGLNAKLYRMYSSLFTKQSQAGWAIPPSIRYRFHLGPLLFYPTSIYLNPEIFLFLLFILLTFIFFLLSDGLLTIIPFSRFIVNAAEIAAHIGLVVVAAYILRDGQLHHRGTVILAVVFGIVLALRRASLTSQAGIPKQNQMNVL